MAHLFAAVVTYTVYTLSLFYLLVIRHFCGVSLTTFAFICAADQVLTFLKSNNDWTDCRLAIGIGKTLFTIIFSNEYSIALNIVE